MALRRRETQADDQARTGRLLDGLDAAYLTRTGDLMGDADLDDFETVIAAAVHPHDGVTYPPAGHGYPRR
ncbi:hypothetical protein ACLVWQ_17635 (plasmid) [Streptomyces sp. CWNU-52B]|uniref:hypothetical protein n=1 Tax=unclassified Streptomyces TaxID=2593676 RepID=UPI0039C0EDDC